VLHNSTPRLTLLRNRRRACPSGRALRPDDLPLRRWPTATPADWVCRMIVSTLGLADPALAMHRPGLSERTPSGAPRSREQFRWTRVPNASGRHGPRRRWYAGLTLAWQPSSLGCTRPCHTPSAAPPGPLAPSVGLTENRAPRRTTYAERLAPIFVATTGTRHLPATVRACAFANARRGTIADGNGCSFGSMDSLLEVSVAFAPTGALRQDEPQRERPRASPCALGVSPLMTRPSVKRPRT
jgi:hypothetical protein